MNASIKLALLDGVTGPLRRVQQAIAAGSKAMESFSERADKAFEKGEHIKITGEKVREFAEKSHELVEKLVMPFEHLEQAMNRVEAATGANKEQMEEVEKAARKVGASGRAGADEAAGALEIMATSGFKVTSAVDSLGTMLDRAKVQNVSLAEATTGATDTAKKFGLALDDEVLTHLNDLTAKMAIASGTSFSNMNAALLESGVAAKAAGVSMERTTELVGLLAMKGVQGGAAGETLNLMFRNMNKAGIRKTIGEASGGMVKLRDATGALRDPLSILTDLTKDMTAKGVGLGAQTAFLNQLFPRNAAKIQALMQAASGDGLEKLDAALKDVAGTTQSMAKKEMQNGIDKTRTLDGAMTNLASTIGATMSPRMDAYKKELTDVVNKSTEWIKANPKINDGLGLLAQGASTGAGALDKFTGAATIFLALKGAGLTGASWVKFGAAMGGIAAPVGAAAAAITGLIYAGKTLYEDRDDVKALTGDIGKIGQATSIPGIVQMGGDWATKKLTDMLPSTYQPQGGAAANGAVDINVHGAATGKIAKGSQGLSVNHDARAGVPMLSE